MQSDSVVEPLAWIREMVHECNVSPRLAVLPVVAMMLLPPEKAGVELTMEEAAELLVQATVLLGEVADLFGAEGEDRHEVGRVARVGVELTWGACQSVK